MELNEVLSPESWADLLRGGRRRRFRRRDVLVREGDPADAAHLLLTGHLGIRATLPNGDEGMIGIRSKGQLVGEMALIGHGPSIRSATVVALVDSETLTLPRGRFDQLRREQPAVGEWLLGLVSDRLRETSVQLMEALYESADVRVLRRLVDAAGVFGAVVPMTQDDLASMAGTTRPTTNRVLQRAQQAGVVSMTRGRIHVEDGDALRRIAGMPPSPGGAHTNGTSA